MTSNDTVTEEAAETDLGLVSTEQARELSEAGKVKLLDVRTKHEWDAGHLPGAEHVLLNDLSETAASFGPDQPLLVYCRAGTRSAFAAEGLRSAGLDARAVAGGALAWAEAELPLVPEGGYISESGEAAAILEARERSGNKPPSIDW